MAEVIISAIGGLMAGGLISGLAQLRRERQAALQARGACLGRLSKLAMAIKHSNQQGINDEKHHLGIDTDRLLAAISTTERRFARFRPGYVACAEVLMGDLAQVPTATSNLDQVREPSWPGMIWEAVAP